MGPPQIMIVEDEPGICKTIEHTLKNLGYGVAAVALSGEEALRKAADTRPDLILMDIVLTGKMDGIETAGRIRDRLDIPVIYLTGSGDEKTLKRAKPTDPFGYLLKPFQERELYTAIELALYKYRMEKKLKEREAWFKTTLRCIGDGVIATDARHECTYMNPVAELLTGWKQSEVIGRPLSTIVHLIDQETRLAVPYPDFERLNRRLPFGPEQQAVLVGRSGREIPIEGSTGCIRDGEGNLNGVVIVFRDMTHRRLAEKALQQSCGELEAKVAERTAELMRANEALRAEVTERQLREEDLRRSEAESKRLAQANAIIAEIGRIISSTLNMEEVYERFTEEVRKLIPFEGISVNVIDYERGTVTFPYVSGFQVTGRQFGDTVPLSDTMVEQIVKTRSGLIVVMDDLTQLQERYPVLVRGYEAGFRSFMFVPLISKDEVIGTIHFRSLEPNSYSDRDLNLAQSIASQVAGAVASARLFAEGRRSAEELRKSEAEARRLAQENAIVAEIGRTITSTLDIEDVYERFAEEVQKLIPFDGISVHIVDLEKEVVTFPYVSGASIEGRNRGESHRLKGTLTEEIVRTRSGLIISVDDPRSREIYPDLSRAYAGGIRSLMIVPLISKDQVIGTIHLRSCGRNVYSNRDLRLAQNIASQIAGAVANARLYAEHKRTEDALYESEKRMKELFEEAPVGYHELDPQGCITRVNRRALEMFGYTAEEMLDQPVWRFLSEAESEVSRRSVLEKIAGIRPFQSSFEHVFRRRDGKMVPVLMEERPLIDKEGRIIGIRSTQQDITERKRAEDTMAALQEQLRQSQKMEAIGQLAGGIAHDFNNLLTVINGYSDLMLNQLQPRDPVHGEAMEIRRAAERAASLTRQLLAFSRKQILQPKMLDLNDLIGNMDKMLRRLIGEDVHLTTKLAKDLGRVKADPGQIEQVIMNIVVNARDAMPSGGSLRIETANREFDQSDILTQVGPRTGRHAMIAISDTGMGMARDVKERIFEPFFTTKEKGKGTGLGLSTVYGIVKQSGGDIRIESEPGRGTRFEIFLPRAEENGDTADTKMQTAQVLHGSETILLVEDEEILRKYARLLLEGNGYRVLEASNGEDALCMVQREKENPIHLLMTDVVMPGMSGRELADSLESLRPGMKVLYISGYTEDQIVRHGVMEKRVNFIQKPFTAEELARKVREVVTDKSQLQS